MTTIKLKYKDILHLYTKGRRAHLCHEYGYDTSFARRVVRGIAVDMYGVIYGNFLYFMDWHQSCGGELSLFEGMLPNIGARVAKMLHVAGLESGEDTPEYLQKVMGLPFQTASARWHFDATCFAL